MTIEHTTDTDEPTDRPSTADVVTADAYPGNALSVVDRAFRLLLAGPCPPAIDGCAVGHGLPARPIDLSELRELLLASDACGRFKDAVWAELVRLARTGDPAWTLGCVGMAMPGLKTLAARTIRVSPRRCVDDVVSELVTEFVAQLARIDTARPGILPRLLLWARKAALRARARETLLLTRDPAQMPAPTHTSGGDPLLLLVEAVRQDIITPDAASLITATRLDGTSVRDVARNLGIPADRLYKRRRAAEARLLTAIRNGHLSAIT